MQSNQNTPPPFSATGYAAFAAIIAEVGTIIRMSNVRCLPCLFIMRPSLGLRASAPQAGMRELVGLRMLPIAIAPGVQQRPPHVH